MNIFEAMRLICLKKAAFGRTIGVAMRLGGVHYGTLHEVRFNPLSITVHSSGYVRRITMSEVPTIEAYTGPSIGKIWP